MKAGEEWRHEPVHHTALQADGSEGDMSMRFYVDGKMAGNLHLVWNPHAAIRTKDAAEELLRQTCQHISYILTKQKERAKP